MADLYDAVNEQIEVTKERRAQLRLQRYGQYMQFVANMLKRVDMAKRDRLARRNRRS